MTEELRNASGDDPGFSQAEIDVLLKNAAQSGGAESAAAVGAIQQQDIDALLKAGGMESEESSASESKGPSSDVPEADTITNRSFDDIDQRPPNSSAGTSVQPYDFDPLDPAPDPSVDPKRVSMLGDVNLRVKVQLGQTRMLVEEVLKLGEGSVVELDKLAGDPVDILVNDRLIARGEVLVLNDNFCVRVSEVLSNNPHRVTV